jgi:hypothetical protein
MSDLATTVDLGDALVGLGESVNPVILGDPEGYIERAKEFLRCNLCPSPCQVLAAEGFTSFVDTAGIIADMLHVAVYGVNPHYSAAVVWKAAAALARYGLPATLGCVPCPLSVTVK